MGRNYTEPPHSQRGSWARRAWDALSLVSSTVSDKTGPGIEQKERAQRGLLFTVMIHVPRSSEWWQDPSFAVVSLRTTIRSKQRLFGVGDSGSLERMNILLSTRLPVPRIFLQNGLTRVSYGKNAKQNTNSLRKSGAATGEPNGPPQTAPSVFSERISLGKVRGAAWAE